MVNFTILAGGASAFVASYVFDADKHTLTYLGQTPTADHPSWISLHPTNDSILYVTNENTNGSVQSFMVGPRGALTLVDTVSSAGAGPAYCALLATGQVGVANYGSGSVSFIPTEYDGLHFSGENDVWRFPVPTTGTQGTSEPHMIYQYGREVLVPDKGSDKIWRFGQIDGQPNTFVVHGDIQQPIGSGPRHIRIKDDELYTLHELSSTLTLQKVPPYPNGTTPILSNVTIVPPDPPAGALFAAAEILIPDPTEMYPISYIYVSNRNVGVQDPRGDTIAIFENVDDQLVLRNQVYTGLNEIRGMLSGERAGASGETYIVAAGVSGTAGVKVFERTEWGANLKEVAVDMTIPARSSFVWLR